jgi:hypothetical protein
MKLAVGVRRVPEAFHSSKYTRLVERVYTLTMARRGLGGEALGLTTQTGTDIKGDLASITGRSLATLPRITAGAGVVFGFHAIELCRMR